MGGFGDRLRQAREARGATLERVAQATRVKPAHLAALERGEHQALPAAPFTKGYIKAYAQFLDIDARPILEAYASELQQRGLDTPESRDKVLQELSHLVAKRSGGVERSGLPVKGLVVSFGVALVLLAAVWLVSRTGARSAAPVSALPTSSPTASAPAPVRAEASEPSVASAPAEPKAEIDPTPAPAPTPPPRRATSSATLRITESGVGTDVSNRRLVGRADRFVEGTEVVFWTLVAGGDAGDTIRHVWFHRGQAVTRADLEIGGGHWRTYSRRVLPRGATGDWMVEARAADGRLLARQEFQCVGRER